MKRMRNLVSTLVGLLALIVLAAALPWLLKAQRALPGPQALTSQPVAGVSQQDSPLPTPTWAPTPLPPALPTPVVELAPPSTPCYLPTPLPNPPPFPQNMLTPVPTTKTVDLAVGLPDEKRLVYYIMREYSYYEQYVVPLDSSYEAIMQVLNLGPCDTVMYASPIIPPTPAPCVTQGPPWPPTPRLGEYRPWVEYCTPTPLPIAKTVDLAEGLPDEDRTLCIIRRADGTYEKYIIPSELDYESRMQLLKMGPQDTILFSDRVKPMHSTPVGVTPFVEPTTSLPLTPQGTPTPVPITGTVDLAAGTPDEKKIVCIVRRTDGTYEQYIVPSEPDLETMMGLLNLGPQDVIVAAFPLKPLPSPAGINPQAQ